MIGSNFNEFFFDISPEKTEEEVLATLTERMGAGKARQFMDEFRKVYPDKAPKDMLYVDTRVRNNTLRIADAKSGMGEKVYVYHFQWIPENNVLGASHGMELPFMFNNVARQREMTGSSESAYRLADIVSDYWISFIKTGDPNATGRPVWEPYTPDGGASMVLDNACGTKRGHDKVLVGLAQ